MISLPGLLLTTQRFDLAADVLRTWSGACRHGLIPNRFDDRTAGEAHYNTADASLWFLHAVHAYLDQAGGLGAPHSGALLETCIDIVKAHLDGVTPGVRVADDGLIEAGIEGEALTWMDARIDGQAVTPRIGKPIELSALWHSALRLLATWSTGDQDILMSAANAAHQSFNAFWNEEAGCCFDLLERDGTHWVGNPKIRPNQVIAIGLPHCPLSLLQQLSVMDVVERRLLTPYGLRTLDPNDPEYRSRFTGDMRERDTAYHNGTVWPWLIGPWCGAIRRTDDDSERAERRVLDATSALLASMDHGCIGQIAEVYDGDAPHEPHGCPAQAWSVAELIRVLAPVPEPVVRPI